jgi:1-deoxy-D-xylulose-5-phosphate reductoisomerase
MKKKVVILGSTGSVGRNTLKIIDQYKDLFELSAICANENIDLLQKQINQYNPSLIAMFNDEKAKKLQLAFPQKKILSGIDGITQVALFDADIVVLAMSGSIGLIPTVACIKAGKQIAFANKEVLVAAGEYIMGLVKKHKVQLIPLDSEHSAIFQCLEPENKKKVKRLVLTASGGPFFKYTKKDLQDITLEQALSHPTYSMGSMITINSSTMMNKGLEIIEAMHLFDMDVDKIDVIIHPQSAVHSFVEYVDGSMLAQVSKPDMKIPIQYALFYPNRKENKNMDFFDFEKYNNFEFYKPDFNKFKCLELAYMAAKIKKSMPTFLNAANEVLVNRFLKKEISWSCIALKLEKLMSSHVAENMLNLDDILEIDKRARKEAQLI